MEMWGTPIFHWAYEEEKVELLENGEKEMFAWEIS